METVEVWFKAIEHSTIFIFYSIDMLVYALLLGFIWRHIVISYGRDGCGPRFHLTSVLYSVYVSAVQRNPSHLREDYYHRCITYLPKQIKYF